MAKLLDRMRDEIRTRHYSIRTEQAYLLWAKKFILFHGKRHPSEMGEGEVGAFLTHLAVDRNVAASTQNQALAAVSFLYKNVLEVPLGWVDDVTRAKRPERLPVVFSRDEVRAVLGHLEGTKWLMASLLYGTGMRVMECARLRVKDVDLGQDHIVVRDGKGQKDRVTVLPATLVEPIKRQVEHVGAVHRRDLDEGFGRLYLPFTLAAKYPSADRQDDDDLHPCLAARADGRAEPGGRLVSSTGSPPPRQGRDLHDDDRRERHQERRLPRLVA